MDSGDQYTGTAEIFGLALRQLRENAGLSLRALGRLALYDFTRLSRAERGEILIPDAQVRVLDDVLHAGGLLTGLRKEAAAQAMMQVVPAACSVAGNGTVTLEIQLPGGRSIQVHLSRRHFGQLLAAGALSAALPGCASTDDSQRLAGALDQPARIDAQVIDYFRRALDEYYTADKMLGPRRLIGTIMAQLDVLDDLRRSARPPHAEPLLQVMAQYGEMAGWLLQDSGSLRAAADWSRRAAEWAHCAGDSQMTAYMLIRQANIAVLTDDHAAVVQLAAAAARTQGPVDRKLTALALQQQARGHARLGEQQACFSLLDQAAGILRDHPEVSEPGAPLYLRHYDLRTLDEQSAVCYRQAGQADTAITILENAVTATPRAMTRDQGHLLAKLAVAITQATQPDPGRAASLGLDALAIARTTGSARILRELNLLDSQFAARWPGEAASRSLHDALTA